MRLQHAVTLYLQFRKTHVACDWGGGYTLRRFARLTGSQRKLDSIRLKEVRTFLDGNRPVTSYWRRQYSALRGFFRFALARHWTSKFPLPPIVPKCPDSSRPYIYSQEDIEALIAASKAQQRWLKVDPNTFRMLLLLLYGTGLRLGEALRLTHEDLDRHEQRLTIRGTKFYKTRWVFLGSDLLQLLQRYLRSQHGAYPVSASQFLFPYRDGTPMHKRTVQHAFRRVRALAGLSSPHASQRSPRIHDLRHTFAVHRLTSWYREGADVQILLPRLSTHLGHCNIQATQVYLTMTPQLLEQASARFERFATMKEICHD